MTCAFVSLNFPLWPPRSLVSHILSINSWFYVNSSQLWPSEDIIKVHRESTKAKQGGILPKLLYLAMSCTCLALLGQERGGGRG